MRAKLPRIESRLLRTSRYIAELLVRSRVLAARRTEANIEITPGLLADKGVAHHQPHLEKSVLHSRTDIYNRLTHRVQYSPSTQRNFSPGRHFCHVVSVDPHPVPEWR